MAIISATEVGTTRQDLVSAVVQETLRQKSKYLGLVMDYSASVPAGSKSVYIPRRGTFTAETKAEDTDLTSQALTFTQDQLSLSHLAVLAEVELIAELQSAVNVEAEVIKEAAMELAAKIDSLIRVQLKLPSTSAPDHVLDYVDTSTDVIALADIANARKLMNVQFLPMENRFMAVSPKKEYELLQIASFIQAERYGSAEPIVNGELGRILGFKVILDEALGDAETIFWHKSACAVAVQLQPQFEKMMNLAGIKNQYLMHTVAGAKVLQAGKANVFYNGSGSL
jgi:hypothetical protein